MGSSRVQRPLERSNQKGKSAEEEPTELSKIQNNFSGNQGRDLFLPLKGKERRFWAACQARLTASCKTIFTTNISLSYVCYFC